MRRRNAAYRVGRHGVRLHVFIRTIFGSVFISGSFVRFVRVADGRLVFRLLFAFALDDDNGGDDNDEK